MDLQILVPSVPLAALRSAAPSESSAVIRERVLMARARQLERLQNHGCRTNAEMSPKAMRDTCHLSPAAEAALARLHQVRRGMSARAVDRIIKVARTIADLTEVDQIDEGSVLAAASYRSLDLDPCSEVKLPGLTPKTNQQVASD